LVLVDGEGGHYWGSVGEVGGEDWAADHFGEVYVAGVVVDYCTVDCCVSS
jgi:hypothetical protein